MKRLRTDTRLCTLARSSHNLARRILATLAFSCAAMMGNSAANAQAADGFAAGEHSDLVTATCTRCHSASLVTQNSGSSAVWQLRVNLMQSAHGMPAIDAVTQSAIVDYLATHYGQKTAARRAALKPEFMPANPYDSPSAE